MPVSTSSLCWLHHMEWIDNEMVPADRIDTTNTARRRASDPQDRKGSQTKPQSTQWRPVPLAARTHQQGSFTPCLPQDEGPEFPPGFQQVIRLHHETEFPGPFSDTHQANASTKATELVSKSSQARRETRLLPGPPQGTPVTNESQLSPKSSQGMTVATRPKLPPGLHQAPRDTTASQLSLAPNHAPTVRQTSPGVGQAGATTTAALPASKATPALMAAAQAPPDPHYAFIATSTAQSGSCQAPTVPHASQEAHGSCNEFAATTRALSGSAPALAIGAATQAPADSCLAMTAIKRASSGLAQAPTETSAEQPASGLSQANITPITPQLLSRLSSASASVAAIQPGSDPAPTVTVGTQAHGASQAAEPRDNAESCQAATAITAKQLQPDLKQAGTADAEVQHQLGLCQAARVTSGHQLQPGFHPLPIPGGTLTGSSGPKPCDGECKADVDHALEGNNQADSTGGIQNIASCEIRKGSSDGGPVTASQVAWGDDDSDTDQATALGNGWDDDSDSVQADAPGSGWGDKSHYLHTAAGAASAQVQRSPHDIAAAAGITPHHHNWERGSPLFKSPAAQHSSSSSGAAPHTEDSHHDDMSEDGRGAGWDDQLGESSTAAQTEQLLLSKLLLSNTTAAPKPERDYFAIYKQQQLLDQLADEDSWEDDDVSVSHQQGLMNEDRWQDDDRHMYADKWDEDEFSAQQQRQRCSADYHHSPNQVYGINKNSQHGGRSVHDHDSNQQDGTGPMHMRQHDRAVYDRRVPHQHRYRTDSKSCQEAAHYSHNSQAASDFDDHQQREEWPEGSVQEDDGWGPAQYPHEQAAEFGHELYNDLKVIDEQHGKPRQSASKQFRQENAHYFKKHQHGTSSTAARHEYQQRPPGTPVRSLHNGKHTSPKGSPALHQGGLGPSKIPHSHQGYHHKGTSSHQQDFPPDCDFKPAPFGANSSPTARVLSINRQKPVARAHAAHYTDVATSQADKHAAPPYLMQEGEHVAHSPCHCLSTCTHMTDGLNLIPHHDSWLTLVHERSCMACICSVTLGMFSCK